MNLRRKGPPDSLYMLLDTMCNAFGGIILLAVLVTLLTSKEQENQQETPSDTREMLQRRLSLALDDLKHSLELSTSLEAKASDEHYKKSVALLAARKELQDALEQGQKSIARNSNELEAATSVVPSERLKFLSAQLAAAEASKLETQNGLAAATENTKRLKQRIESLQQQTANIINESQRPLRLPKERETGKRPFWIIVQYGRVYPCKNADLSRNESSIAWTSDGDSLIARPIPGQGYGPGDSAGLRELFRNLPGELVYVAFCVFEDSFAEFNRAKELATSANLAYGWDPCQSRVGPVSFGPNGSKPKPQ